jgi:hypothetical protein
MRTTSESLPPAPPHHLAIDLATEDSAYRDERDQNPSRDKYHSGGPPSDRSERPPVVVSQVSGRGKDAVSDKSDADNGEDHSPSSIWHGVQAECTPFRRRS